ncbi:MAG TPA: chromate transporter [Clostridia bacterium]|nr:chromate transporter [Clostridia bacterium]
MMKKLLKIYWSFFKIGTVTVGSGYAMLPVMRSVFCGKLKWLTDEEMTDIFGLSQSIPGIIAANTASLIGYRLAGNKGAVAGVLGAITPSFIVILVIAMLFPAVAGNIYVQKALLGAQVGITATIIAYAVRTGRIILKDIFSVALMLVSLILGLVFDANLFLLIAGGGFAGWAYYTVRRAKDAADS